MTNSNIPGWAPRAPMVVMSDSKMSYFAKASAVRAGIRGSYGALSGLGTDVEFTMGAEDTKAAGGLIFGERRGDAATTKAGGSTQSVSDFTTRLSNTVRDFISGGTQGAADEVAARPPLLEKALVVIAVGVAALVAWRLLK